MTAVGTEVPSRRRSVLAWTALVVVLVAVGLVGAGLSDVGRWAERDRLDPESAGPQGTMALVSILREQGVDVVIARDRDTARSALGPGTTLVSPDAAALSDEAVTELVEAAGDAVLLEPRSRTARLFFGDAELAAVAPEETVDPSCALPDAQRAGAVVPGTTFTEGTADAACYPSDDGFGLLVAERSAASRVALIDGTELFTNEYLAQNGNAALAIGLMGRHPVVVWYVPSLVDSDLDPATPSLGELTPPWVTPAILLLLLAAIAAALWRGRRFGPLVAENLPVTVRASETMEGRARLYARSRDAVHAADALRIGAIGRLARELGLGPAASAAEVADAAADRIGAPRTSVRGILIDSVPRTDAELVAVSDRLRDLEAAVRASFRTERNAP
ncbi:DUF4350 domain-containing protein [Microbacterium sp. DT81.1]|uniref:DUF4350 domain-containing protein n=1 Tax=Microbacterium sp. DT81.1 TaxID=3393413 RepID=UPI003CEBA3C6